MMRLLAVSIAFTFVASGARADDSPKAIFDSAISVWHLGNRDDSAGVNSRLETHEDVRLGSALDPETLGQQSRLRGGDGLVAELANGWLDAGQGNNGELNLAGDQFTALIRLRCKSASLWTTRGFFTKGGGHDELVFNFFSHDFDQGPSRMRLGCEIGIDGKPGLAGQVTALVDQVGPEQWHDLIARYNGANLALFIDGVKLDEVAVAGPLRQGNTFPLAIGSGGPSDLPFPGAIDHAALWDRALTDSEVVTLSGGQSHVESMRAKFANYTPPPIQTPTPQLVEKSRALKERFARDLHRPRFHFLSPEEGDAMPFDPNGAIFYQGRYHLFYIFQRHQDAQPQTVHCWGHASSIDLLHWRHHPTALDVADSDPDRGIFSGNAFLDHNGVPTILYHGVGLGNCIAQSTDDELIHWRKSPTNPIVPIPQPGEPGYGKYDSWDPHGWLENETYYSIFGGNPHTGAVPALFRGPKLTSLVYQGPLLTNDRWSEADEDVSCPDFFPMGDRHVLVCISHMRGARYFVGQWNDEKFTPESHGRMNWPGGAFFAPETLLDANERRILWGWCLDQRPGPARIHSGWSGVMSVPRVLSLEPDHSLRIEPIEELRRLRLNPRQHHDLLVRDSTEMRLDDVHGDSLEMELEMTSQSATEYGVKLRQTPDAEEETSIVYDATSGELSIDVSKSTLDPAIRYRSWCLTVPKDPDDANREVSRQSAPLQLAPGEPLRLRIFLDRSILEVFANERQCLTQRIWPTRSDAMQVGLHSDVGDTRVRKLMAWEIAATNSD